MVNRLGETRLRKIAYALKFLAWILITASIFLPWYRVNGSGRDIVWYFAGEYSWLFLIDLDIFPLVVFSSITGFLSLILSHYGTRLKVEVLSSLASGFMPLAPIIYKILFLRSCLTRMGTWGSIPPSFPTFVPYLNLLGALIMLLSFAPTFCDTRLRKREKMVEG